jgi:hypothetical protein
MFFYALLAKPDAISALNVTYHIVIATTFNQSMVP